MYSKDTMPNTFDVTEKELVEMLQNKNEWAMRIIYKKYAKTLFGILLKIVKTDPPAADLWQESMIKIWNHAHTYHSGKGTFFTWMLNICRNTGIDHLKSAGHKRNLQTVDVQYAYENSVYQETDQIGLREKTMQIPEEYRVIVDLLYFQGYTQAEAAEALCMPLGSLKTKARAALHEIKKIFAENDRG